jgi:hypothetical protein
MKITALNELKIILGCKDTRVDRFSVVNCEQRKKIALLDLILDKHDEYS